MSREKKDIEKINDEIEKILEENDDIISLEDKDNYNDSDNTKKIDNINNFIIESNIAEEVEYKKNNDDKKEENELDLEAKSIKNKNSKKKAVIISLIVGSLIILIVIVLFFIFFNKKTKVSDIEDIEKLSSSEQKEIINNYGEALEGIIEIYYQKQNVLLEYDDAIKLVDLEDSVECREHYIYDDGLVYLNKCTINEQKTKYSYGKKQEKKEEPIVKEGDIKVYVNKASKEATLITPKYLENYEIYSFNIEGAFSDLNLLDKKNSSYIYYYDSNFNVQMIDFKTGEKVLNHVNYKGVLPIKNSDNFDLNLIGVNINDKWGIYNLNTGNCVIYPRFDNISLKLTMGTTGPPLYTTTLDGNKLAVSSNGVNGVIDYTNGVEIIPIIYSWMLESGNYLWVTDSKNNGHLLDYNGNEYLNDKYNKVYGVVDGKYVLVNDLEMVKLVKISGQEIYNYGKVELGDYNYGLAYNNGALFQFSKQDGDYSNCIEVIYDPSTKKGEIKDSSCGGIAKPILYLYPKKTTNITVSFEHPELLVTTYPKFNGKWEITAKSNGDLVDQRKRYYYGLYWDEVKVHSVDFSKGYYVSKENAISFLEKKLDYIGLSEREANEFIMYWLPVLEKNEKSLVYFELTEERESYNKINISPKPDSLLRLVIHIKKVDKEVNISKQSLIRFQRKGFVAVEWGGVVY